MLTFASVIAFFGLLHIAIGRARQYISTNFVITPDNIEIFDLKRYLAIYTLTTNFNRRYGDPEIKTCVKERQRLIISLYFTFLVNEEYDKYRKLLFEN